MAGEATKAPEPALLFPSWQISRGEYASICAHLELTPRDAIYHRLLEYLAQATFREEPPRGFAAYLAGLELTPFRIARLDLITARFFPTHPFRHAINAVVALHECDGDGYLELSRAPTGPWLLPSLVLWGVQLIASLLVTPPWLAWHGLRYLTGSRPGLNLALQGKRVLVTGVSRGLGRDLFTLALEQGAQVIGTVRDEASAAALRDLLPKTAPARVIVADLSVPERLVGALVESEVRPEEIDIAILSAGTKHDGASLLSVQDLTATFRVNFFAPAEFAAWFCPKAKGAVLVFISSIGRWHGMPHSGGYNASKAALSIWADGLAMERSAPDASTYHILTVEPGLFASAMVELTGLMRWLAVPRAAVARRIMAAAEKRRPVLRYPTGFSILTFGLCGAGRGIRARVFSKIRGEVDQ